jgi:hypothetical protein
MDDTPIYPEPRRGTSAGMIPLILWFLPMFAGLLVWFAREPSQIPALNSLTEFICDPHPAFQSGSARGQVSLNYYTCRSGNQRLYQRTSIPVGAGKERAWATCVRANGAATIWRHTNPSPYGVFIFQSACGGEIYASYDAQVANYRASRTIGGVVASVLVVLSTIQLGIHGFRWIRGCRPRRP